MMMGGVLILLLLLLPLVLVGLVIVAGLGLLGQAPDIADWLRMRTPNSLPEPGSGMATRHCTECGQPLQRGWAHCPGCGVEVHWV
jgi:hypothetical protein